jgi:hypothetical protein
LIVDAEERDRWLELLCINLRRHHAISDMFAAAAKLESLIRHKTWVESIRLAMKRLRSLDRSIAIGKIISIFLEIVNSGR